MTATPTLDASSSDRAASVGARGRAGGPSHGSGLGWIFTAFFGVFGWAIGLAKLTDNSFFWHLRTGEYILDHGIPHHDVFSYTAPGTKWVAQSWLAEATYALLFRSMGGFGIRLFIGLVGAGIGMLTYRLALRLVRDRLVACGLTAAALAGIYTRVVGAAAADRRAVPARAALDGRGARLASSAVTRWSSSRCSCGCGRTPTARTSSGSRTSVSTCSVVGSTAHRRGPVASGGCCSAR